MITTTKEPNTQIVSGVKAELMALAADNETLTPQRVLDRARDPASALHSHFEWDDGVAAEKFRLVQAGMMIRQCRIRVIQAEGPKTWTVRAFTSLPSDRLPGLGYRKTETVLADPPKRTELLSMALAELAMFKRKYQMLSELADVFESIDRITKVNA